MKESEEPRDVRIALHTVGVCGSDVLNGGGGVGPWLAYAGIGFRIAGAAVP